MELLGRQIGFLRTVEAECRIVEEMDGGDASKGISAVLSKDFMESYRAAEQFLPIMSAGYESRKHFEDPSHEMRPLTTEEVKVMTKDELALALFEAMTAWQGEKPTVETEPAKKKKDSKDSKETKSS